MTSDFNRRAADALQDTQLRTMLTRSTRLLQRLREEGVAGVDAGFEQVRSQAAASRQRTLDDLPALLEQLQFQVKAHGGEVFFADDAAAAARYVAALAHSRGVRGIVRSRSTIAEEIDLDAALAAAGLRVVDTNLGDYILQLAGEQSSHPVYPALHKRKEDVAALLQEKLDMPQTLDVQGMASMVRYKLRKEFMQVDMSVSGVDFAVAQTGTLAVASSSGNDCFALAMAPRVHVALMGLERVVPGLEDLTVLLEARARSSAGQPLPDYVNLIGGAALEGDPDGPGELHLVIVDNGRSDLLRWGFGEALACIGCGACVGACPVYREIGGHAYGGRLAGPIGGVMLPLLPSPPEVSERRPAKPTTAAGAGGASWHERLKATRHADLPFASTLCGACADVCPVGIDLPALLLRLRSDLDAAGRGSWRGRRGRRLFARAMSSPGQYKRLTGWLRRSGRLLGKESIRRLPPPLHHWCADRDLPAPAERSFRERWEARNR